MDLYIHLAAHIGRPLQLVFPTSFVATLFLAWLLGAQAPVCFELFGALQILGELRQLDQVSIAGEFAAGKASRVYLHLTLISFPENVVRVLGHLGSVGAHGVPDGL